MFNLLAKTRSLDGLLGWDNSEFLGFVDRSRPLQRLPSRASAARTP